MCLSTGVDSACLAFEAAGITSEGRLAAVGDPTYLSSGPATDAPVDASVVMCRRWTRAPTHRWRVDLWACAPTHRARGPVPPRTGPGFIRAGGFRWTLFATLPRNSLLRVRARAWTCWQGLRVRGPAGRRSVCARARGPTGGAFVHACARVDTLAEVVCVRARARGPAGRAG